jgi:hypothetical protein
MRQSRPQMIARSVQENLRLVFQSAKSAGVNDSRPIALKLRSIRMPRLRIFSSARFTRFLRERRERSRFVRFHLLAPLPACA